MKLIIFHKFVLPNLFAVLSNKEKVFMIHDRSLIIFSTCRVSAWHLEIIDITIADDPMSLTAFIDFFLSFLHLIMNENVSERGATRKLADVM